MPNKPSMSPGLADKFSLLKHPRLSSPDDLLEFLEYAFENGSANFDGLIDELEPLYRDCEWKLAKALKLFYVARCNPNNFERISFRDEAAKSNYQCMLLSIKNGTGPCPKSLWVKLNMLNSPQTNVELAPGCDTEEFEVFWLDNGQQFMTGCLYFDHDSNRWITETNR